MRQKSRLIHLAVFTLCLAFTTANKPRSLVHVDDVVRIEHAKELLGVRYYERSPIFYTRGYRQINQFILQQTQNYLPKKYKKRAFAVAQAIIAEANTHQLDPLFLMAMVKQESSFNPDAVGGVGELGLMQIRPETGEWIAKKFGLKWRGASTLKDPIGNLNIGAQYMSYLREKFGHGRLYLSAYNMGPNKVRSYVEKNVWPKDYSSGVMKKYLDLNKALATKVNLENVSQTRLIALKD